MSKRNELERQPLGTLITSAMEAESMNRSDLSKATGIPYNSLVRYEKCEVDETGQYPPANKLALICHHLNIPPSQALWNCLDEQKHFEQRERSYDEVDAHPEFMYMQGEYFELLKENATYRQLLRLLVMPGKEHEGPRLSEVQDWGRSEARKVIEAYDQLERRLLQSGIASMVEYPKLVMSGRDMEGSLRNREDASVPRTTFALEQATKQISILNQKLDEYKKSPEEDLPSPPSSDPNHTPITKKESDDG